ncbi:MAG: hypothetical protein LIO76_04195 [Clostridiales bacterium]|nr:hypothetical protein [Clostridiales bacterium]
MILYEDNEIIVCHKPAGVPVQSVSVRTKDMVSILRSHLQEERERNSVYREAAEVYVVHRLDQPVEGVLVFAKTKRAAADLSRQAAGDGMKKRYLAVAEITEMQDRTGRAAPLENADAMGAACVLHQKAMQDRSWHTLVDYLVKDGRNNRSFVSEAGKKDAKRAELRYRILQVREPYGQETEAKTAAKTDAAGQVLTRRPGAVQTSGLLALTEIELMTGRHHQIRVQMAHAGMPLFGDQKYNPGYAAAHAVGAESAAKPGGESGVKPDAGSGRPPLALCAVSLTFRHPVTQKEMTFTAEPEAEIFREMTGSFS